MRLLDAFARVGKSSPCPICHKPDWCLIQRDGATAICKRIESPVAWGDAGWLHRLTHDQVRFEPRRARTITCRVTPDLSERARLYRARVDARSLERFAKELGVVVASLERLGIGWTGRAWAFPMWCGDRLGGIRLRCLDGTRLSVKGGREGLFIPTGIAWEGALYVAEGPTDTAALLSLGLDAVGRPSCSGGKELLRRLIQGRHPQSVVVVADADEAGQLGAKDLSVLLALYCRDVRVITPPVKDARAWVRAGASRENLLALVESAGAIKLRVQVRRASA